MPSLPSSPLLGRAIRRSPGELKLIDPHVVSVDAITPRAHGGRYVAGNIAFVCWSCNTAKGHGSVAALRSFLQTMKTNALPGSGSFLAVEPPPRLELDANDLAYIRAWAQQQHVRLRDRIARAARKAGDLSYEDILQMGCARYLGQGRYHGLLACPWLCLLPQSTD